MRPAWARYGLAILAVFAALVLRWSLRDELAAISPFRLFFAAVMLGAAFGGFGPGLVASILATLVVNVYFIEPVGSFKLLRPGLPLRMGLFFGEMLFISILSGLVHSARRRAEISEAALLRDVAERRRLERVILEISDAEQQRIGSDLHDGLGQHLTGIAFMTKVLHQKLAGRGAPEAENAQRITELVSQAIGWTRDLARGLATVDLKSGGLAGSLHELASRTRELFNVQCVCKAEDVQVDERFAVHLYRIAQEAVTNAMRHGKASTINLTLRMEGPALMMKVEDDGIGIDPNRQNQRGMGLQIMQYRAKMIGATVEIGPGPEGGTILTCRLPVRPGQPSEGSSDDSREPAAHA